jgi:ribA/ribD-fused uncharacterized protein
MADAKESKEYIYFWQPNNPQGFLSMWYISHFRDEEGNIFESAEQYLLYRKAKLFDDRGIAFRILRSSSPRTVKEIVKTLRFDLDVWVREREKIAYKANYLKFMQNRSLYEQFMAFKPGTKFVEASPLDNIWGIGFPASTALENQARWGKNILGNILEKLRNDLERIPFFDPTDNGIEENWDVGISDNGTDMELSPLPVES